MSNSSEERYRSIRLLIRAAQRTFEDFVKNLADAQFRTISLMVRGSQSRENWGATLSGWPKWPFRVVFLPVLLVLLIFRRLGVGEPSDTSDVSRKRESPLVWELADRAREDQRERRTHERLVVGVMAREFEKSIGLSCIVLFIALTTVGAYAIGRRDATMITIATVICIIFLLAILRQAIMMWRMRKGYFGSSEHEVRELLSFAMQHQTPDDFFDDNGNILPAFDVAFRESRTAAYAGVPQPDHS